MIVFHLTACFASLTAFAVLSVGGGATCFLLFAAALLALLRLDYAPRRTLRLPTRRRFVPRARFRPPALSAESHRVAA